MLPIFKVAHNVNKILGDSENIFLIFNFSQHMVDLIAVDGDDILPLRADSVVVGAGERVTLLLFTGNVVKNYWIRFETTEVKSFEQVRRVALMILV